MTSRITEASQQIVDRVHAVRQDTGLSMEEAATEVARQIEAELGQFWATVGPSVVGWLYREGTRPGMLRPPLALVASPGVSWREQIRRGLATSLDLEIPIGSSGVRKRLGDLTADDLRTIAAWYGGVAETYARKSALFARVAERVGGTLEQAWPKLDPQLRRFLEGEVGVPEREPEAA